MESKYCIWTDHGWLASDIIKVRMTGGEVDYTTTFILERAQRFTQQEAKKCQDTMFYYGRSCYIMREETHEND